MLGAEEKARKVNRITKELEANGYPSSVIERAERSAKRRKKQTDQGTKTRKPAEETMITASIPYVKGVSETIGRILRQVDIRTVMGSQKLKWQLMKGAKDTITADTNPGVV